MPDLRPGLPDDVKEQLIALADAGENVWQQVAVITLQLIGQPGAQKMRIYQDVAALLGMKGAGVRAWTGIYQAVGDDLLVEFPQFRFTHWRVLTAAANRLKQPVAELACKWAATADDYGGLPVPPDVLAAKLGKPLDDRPPLVKALERAGAAIISAQRDCRSNPIPGSGEVMKELDAVAATLERLARVAASETKIAKEHSDAGL